MNPTQKLTEEFGQRIKALGFIVMIAEKGTYGIISDETKERVLSFDCTNLQLSGNYGPPSSTSGTGWILSQSIFNLQTKEDVHKALYAHAPLYTGKGWRYYRSLAEYLSVYQNSSRFREL